MEKEVSSAKIIKKWGSSLVIIITSDEQKMLGVVEDDELNVTLKKRK